MTAHDAIFFLCEECNYNPVDENGKLKQGVKWRISLLEKNVKQEDIERFIKKALASIKTEYLRKGELVSIATLIDLMSPDKSELSHKAATVFNRIVNLIHSYRDFVTDDKRAIAGLDRIGGWGALCKSDKSDIKYMSERFIKTYVECNIESIEYKRFPAPESNGGKCVYFGKHENKHLIHDTSREALENLDFLDDVKTKILGDIK